MASRKRPCTSAAVALQEILSDSGDEEGDNDTGKLRLLTK